MALGDLATVKVHYTTGGAIVCQNGLGMQCITPDANWRALLAAEFKATIIPDWRLGLCNTINFLNITVSDVVPGTGADEVLSLSPIKGAVSGQIAPFNCAYCLSIRTEGIGRNTRGRIYLAGMVRTQIFNGAVWDNDVLAWAEELGTVLLAQYGPTGFSDLARWQIISRGPKSAPVDPPQSFPVTRLVFDQRVASMRKRGLR